MTSFITTVLVHPFPYKYVRFAKSRLCTEGVKLSFLGFDDPLFRSILRLYAYILTYRICVVETREREINSDHEAQPKAQPATSYVNMQKPPLVEAAYARLSSSRKEKTRTSGLL